MSAENAQKPQNHTGTGENREANGDSSDANLYGILSVHVESLRWPEHDDGEEIGTRDERNYQSKCQDSGVLTKPAWEHGVLGKLDFPDGKEDKEHGSDDERNEGVGV